MYAEEQQAVVRDDAPALQDPVIKQMVVQLRAMDSYGTYDTWSDARVLDPLVLTRERRRAIPSSAIRTRSPCRGSRPSTTPWRR